ncbi:hypothetical protein HY358_00045 [Candidatus Roizmanbacteria bacterium]|nr:hypothetical protein [Candidatus Roizmanbacteria bacterium]
MQHFFHHIQKEFLKHTFDYLLLITGGVLFLIGLNIFNGERLMEYIILLTFTSLYIVWGIYHHIIDDTLHLRTVIEYILIGFTIIFLMKVIVFPN